MKIQVKLLALALLLLPVLAEAQIGMDGMSSRGRRGGSLRPYYTGGSVTGRVVDSAGNPVKGASVILQQRDNDPNPNGQTDAKPVAPYYNEITTKKNGKFKFSTLRTFHSYVIAISADGYRRWERNISFSGKMRGQSPGETKDSTIAASSLESWSAEKDLGDVQLATLHH